VNEFKPIPAIPADDPHPDPIRVEQKLIERASPTIQSVIGRFAASDRSFGPDDRSDVASTVTLRVLRWLRRTDYAIRDFEHYVASLTYNTIYDFMRKRYPERTRLKNRIRYLHTHDPELAMWNASAGVVCGLRAWRGRQDVVRTFSIERGAASSEMSERDCPREAVLAVHRRAGGPLLLDNLVAIVASLWNIRETPVAELQDRHAAATPIHAARSEDRQILRALWNEILLLPVRHRTALLLNLRDPSGVNAVALFVLIGVASFDEVAAALDMSPDELAAMWDSLPLDDLTIAARLSTNRQQVINLRRTARERLGRRRAQ
jgi:hypothetical protein